jgi:hypothetical protein
VLPEDTRDARQRVTPIATAANADG